MQMKEIKMVHVPYDSFAYQTYTHFPHLMGENLGSHRVHHWTLWKNKVNTFDRNLRHLFLSFSIRIETASDCQACEEADTYENIMDHFCRADFGKKSSNDLFFLLLAFSMVLCILINLQWPELNCDASDATKSVARNQKC